jgi:hypothetical protein
VVQSGSCRLYIDLGSAGWLSEEEGFRKGLRFVRWSAQQLATVQATPVVALRIESPDDMYYCSSMGPCMKSGSERRTSKCPALVFRHTNLQNRTPLRSTSLALDAVPWSVCCFKTDGSALFTGRSSQAAEPSGIRPYVVGLPAATGDLRNRTVRVPLSYVELSPAPPRTISGNQPGGSIHLPFALFIHCHNSLALRQCHRFRWPGS